MKRFLMVIIVVGLFVGSLWLGWTFRANNAAPVDLDLIWLRIPNVELWMLMVAAVGLGAAIAALLVGFAWLRGRVVLRRLRKIVKKLESELHQLRSLPLAGSDGASLDAEEGLVVAKKAKQA